MNIEKLERIASWLESGAPETNGITSFNMGVFIAPKVDEDFEPRCGTQCCIAGAALQFEAEVPYGRAFDVLYRFNRKPDEVAMEILGLSVSQAQDLFYAQAAMDLIPLSEDERDGDELDHVGPAWAARCIRNLMATGEVDWKATYRAEEH
jgi:hypothetical protein